MHEYSIEIQQCTTDCPGCSPTPFDFLAQQLLLPDEQTVSFRKGAFKKFKAFIGKHSLIDKPQRQEILRKKTLFQRAYQPSLEAWRNAVAPVRLQNNLLANLGKFSHFSFNFLKSF